MRFCWCLLSILGLNLYCPCLVNLYTLRLSWSILKIAGLRWWREYLPHCKSLSHFLTEALCHIWFIPLSHLSIVSYARHIHIYTHQRPAQGHTLHPFPSPQIIYPYTHTSTSHFTSIFAHPRWTSIPSPPVPAKCVSIPSHPRLYSSWCPSCNENILV